VAASTKGYQILGGVIPQLTSRLNVVDLQPLDRAARLAAPAIPLKDFTTESAVGVRIEPQAWAFGPDLTQGATRMLSISCCRSGAGRLNTKRVMADRRAS